jgi:hypothetical protein
MLLGQGALAIAAPAAPQATIQTRIASCAGLDFHPIDGRTQFRWQERILYRANSEGDGWFMCAADLPHRAVVTKVRFTVRISSNASSSSPAVSSGSRSARPERASPTGWRSRS